MTRRLVGRASRGAAALIVAVWCALGPVPVVGVAAAQQGLPEAKDAPEGQLTVPGEPFHDLRVAVVRLPLAAALGTALALRPKRRGTPPRTPAVAQTQIILSVVGAVIMLVVGASLARAFGIVGAANLIRYRAKIDDPKDAGVMLCCLAVGLAAGVGLYALSVFSTVFLVLALFVIESFAPKAYKHFELTIKGSERSDDPRPAFERVLQRYHVEYELRTASNEEICYDVRVPFGLETDRITNALLKIDARDDTAVVWDEKKIKSS
jgi:uncharacterized membrane protein YhiD involved in acid resistance